MDILSPAHWVSLHAGWRRAAPSAAGTAGQTSTSRDFYARHLHPQLSMRAGDCQSDSARQAASADAVTLHLVPNYLWRGFRAGQHVTLTVEIDGVPSPCFYASAANAGLRADHRHASPAGWYPPVDQVYDGDYLQISPAFMICELLEPVPQKLPLIGCRQWYDAFAGAGRGIRGLQMPDYTTGVGVDHGSQP